MQNFTKIILALFSIALVAALLIGRYQNKGLIEEKEREWKQPYQTVKIGDEDDYYELTIPREFGAMQSKDNTSAVFMRQILYPEMKRWEAEPRELLDVMSYISLTYHTRERARLNNRESVLNDSIKRYNFLTKPTDEISKKMIQKYPDIKVYGNKETKKVGYYVFKDKNGALVYLNLSETDFKSLSDSKGFFMVSVSASYKDKFEIDFNLPRKFFYETPDVVNSVIDLISTFNPTHYKNHNSQSEAAMDQEIESQESKEKIPEKVLNKTAATTKIPTSASNQSSVKK